MNDLKSFQLNILSSFLDDDNKILIPVYLFDNSDGKDIYVQSYLIHDTDVKEELENNNISCSFEGLKPGNCSDGLNKTTYHRWGSTNNYEPFVIEQRYNNDKYRNKFDIVEEFRLLFNLYFDSIRKKYIDVENDDIDVINFYEKEEEDKNVVYKIEVNKKYLKSYLALKKMCMVIHLDSRYKEQLDYKNELDKKEKNYTASLKKSDNNSLILFCKKIIQGCALEDCIVPPYNDGKKEYIDYIIGVDSNGNNIMHTCDLKCIEDKYLTPVYFKRDVLRKYIDDSQKYEVEDGMLSCGTQWSLPIDNCDTPKENISVYLGDLSYIPTSEMRYWQSFNIPYDGNLSRSKINRDFKCFFSDSSSPDHVFKSKYKKVLSAFEKNSMWPLFRPLEKADKYCLDTCQIINPNNQREFDCLVLWLTKILIDSINEEKIENDCPNIKEKKGIERLKAFFSVKGLTDYDKHIIFLKELQNLRSSGGAHRKGTRFQKIMQKYEAKYGSKEDIIIAFFNCANNFLSYILANIQKMK